MKMAMKAKMSMKMKKMAMKMSMKMRKMAMKKTDLKKNKAGKIVSRKASDAAKKKKGFKKIAAWGAAFKAARKALGIKGFCPCGGKTRQGQQLLAKTKSLYKK